MTSWTDARGRQNRAVPVSDRTRRNVSDGGVTPDELFAFEEEQRRRAAERATQAEPESPGVRLIEEALGLAPPLSPPRAPPSPLPSPPATDARPQARRPPGRT